MVDDRLGRSLDPIGTSFYVCCLGSGEAIQMLPCLSMGTLMVVDDPLVRSQDSKGTDFCVCCLVLGEAILMLSSLLRGILAFCPWSQLLCMIFHWTQPWVHVVQ